MLSSPASAWRTEAPSTSRSSAIWSRASRPEPSGTETASLPTVLSAQLGVNPNTVQKACRMLEEAGLITSRSGAKSEFTLDEAAVAAVRARLMEREAAALVRSLRQMGLTRPEAAALIDRLWDSPELEEEKP